MGFLAFTKRIPDFLLVLPVDIGRHKIRVVRGKGDFHFSQGSRILLKVVRQNFDCRLELASGFLVL
jgi:hypothetical protein